MKRTVLILLVLCLVVVLFLSATYGSTKCGDAIEIIRIRSCGYVIAMEQGGRGIAICHAADCPNPIHNLKDCKQCLK